MKDWRWIKEDEVAGGTRMLGWVVAILVGAVGVAMEPVADGVVIAGLVATLITVDVVTQPGMFARHRAYPVVEKGVWSLIPPMVLMVVVLMLAASGGWAVLALLVLMVFWATAPEAASRYLERNDPLLHSRPGRDRHKGRLRGVRTSA